MKSLLWVIIATLFGLISAEVFTGTYRVSGLYYFSNLDSETKGEIVTSKAEHFGGYPGGLMHVYDIEYLYFVGTDHKSYKSNIVKYDTRNKDVDINLKKYPLGKKVTVYYDSESPSLATLEKSDSLPSRIYIQWAINLLLVPLVVFFLSRIIK